ncbi:unnamed protein product [Phytomonas sp. EM1]|nr:unnamed protein product [Phytomonas sp. EM1]|eukprot:CCW64936.1 unnamed protein product [Phytomonas sp. isolate EM1]
MDFQYFDALHRILLSHLQRGNAMAAFAIIALPHVHENPLFWRTCTYPEGLVAAIINGSGLEACNNPSDHAKQHGKELLVTPKPPSSASGDVTGGSGGEQGATGDSVCGVITPVQNSITPAELYIMLQWCMQASFSRVRGSRSGPPITRGEGSTRRDEGVPEGGILQEEVGPQPPISGHSCRGVSDARRQTPLEGDAGAIILHTLLGETLAHMEHPPCPRQTAQHGDPTRESSRPTPTSGSQRRKRPCNRESEVHGGEESDQMPDLRMLSNLLQTYCSHMTYRNPLQSVLVPPEGCSHADGEGAEGRGRGGAGPCAVRGEGVGLDSTSSGGTSSGAGAVVAPTVELHKRGRCIEQDDLCVVGGPSSSPPLQKRRPSDANLDTSTGPDATTGLSQHRPVPPVSQRGDEAPPPLRPEDSLTRMLEQIAEVKRDVPEQPFGVSALFELLDRSVAEEDALEVLRRVTAVPGTTRVAEDFDSVGSHPRRSRSPVARAAEKRPLSTVSKASQPSVAPSTRSPRRETSEPFASAASVAANCHVSTVTPVRSPRRTDQCDAVVVTQQPESAGRASPAPSNLLPGGGGSLCDTADEPSAVPRAPQLLVRHPTTHEERVAAAIRAFDELDCAELYKGGEGDGRATTGHSQSPAVLPQSGKIKRRKRFTPEEDEAIIQGVKRFDYQGTTRFQYIFRAFQSVWQPGRTPTHLYDHWRDSLRKRVLQGMTADRDTTGDAAQAKPRLDSSRDAAGRGLIGGAPIAKEACASSVSSEIEDI